MIPGEIRAQAGELELNEGRKTATVLVTNTGDRPVQVGSHYPFFEVNRALRFDRESAYGMRLNIAAGTAVRFEPGEEKPVELTELGGAKRVFGLNGLTAGAAADELEPGVAERLKAWQKLGED
ncbi:urease subunit beta [Cohnella faecalis]|uniref:Urease subunit beta n=1 Tax=Cohnella faecalis TaxID=2315694 RepID=A0A398CVP6_9BACL|nr:urease subunit beta [Cohnella faecalis]RIE03094.1 urease subunit beta [Cohnella faecalis]